MGREGFTQTPPESTPLCKDLQVSHYFFSAGYQIPITRRNKQTIKKDGKGSEVFTECGCLPSLNLNRTRHITCYSHMKREELKREGEASLPSPLSLFQESIPESTHASALGSPDVSERD